MSLQYLVISLVSFGLFGPALSTTNINIVKWRYFVIFSPVFFLFLELGIFLFKLGKKHTFWHWEQDRISVVKMGQKNPCPWFCNFAFFAQIFTKFPPKCRTKKLGMIYTIFGGFCPQNSSRKTPALQRRLSHYISASFAYIKYIVFLCADF